MSVVGEETPEISQYQPEYGHMTKTCISERCFSKAATSCRCCRCCCCCCCCNQGEIWANNRKKSQVNQVGWDWFILLTCFKDGRVVYLIPINWNNNSLGTYLAKFVIFHQPRFPWNKGISLPRRYNLTRHMKKAKHNHKQSQLTLGAAHITFSQGG